MVKIVQLLKANVKKYILILFILQKYYCACIKRLHYILPKIKLKLLKILQNMANTFNLLDNLNIQVLLVPILLKILQILPTANPAKILQNASGNS